ncbi:MAG: ABC transporter ATP-binding protein, partial [Gaiellaceae bacterium]
NAGVDLTIEESEIHCLLGENGAGKSTLMNLLYGSLRLDGGRISIDGRPVEFESPRDAIAAGIGMVHQHFALVPTLTVAENVMLGFERVGRSGRLDRRTARHDVAEMAERYGLEADPDAVVGDLPIGLQQRVEIMKALKRDAQLLILDEPTAVLRPQESEQLFGILAALRESGRSIVFISHKLREVRKVADRVTILRRGHVVGTATPDATESELAALMVGKNVLLGVQKSRGNPGAVVLRADALRVLAAGESESGGGATFEIREGEILSLAGVNGNGQTEVVEALMGLRRPQSGAVTLSGEDVTGLTTREILARGVAFVPEDRRRSGLVAELPVYENLVLDVFARPPFAKGIRLQRKAIRDHAARLISEFDVRAPSMDVAAGTLSGGNQQKVLLARELSRPLRLLIVAEPTRGLDVAAAEFVQRRIVQARDAGAAVLVVTSDLDEAITLGDRLAVIYRGGIVDTVPPSTPRESLGVLMAGGNLSLPVA